MTKIILGIGIPGAGKTTFLKSFADKYKYEYLCVDDMRPEKGLASVNRLVASYVTWKEIREQMKNKLKEGKTVVVDATFASSDLREEFINLARKNGAEKVQGVFLNTDSETAWKRSEERERKISRKLFDKRVSQIKDNPPLINDGFDSIFTVDEYENSLLAETIDCEKRMTYKTPIKLR